MDIKEGERDINELVPKTMEYTIALHRKILKASMRKRAPNAIKTVVKFAQNKMKTSAVKLDPAINVYLWSKGVTKVPHKIRVRLERRINNNEKRKEKEPYITYATYIPVSSFKGLVTEEVEGVIE